MEFITKDDGELIKSVNRALCMEHRTKPYDLKNMDDLIEATKMITGELLDMWHCYSMINKVDGIYDEAMEYYHTAAWAGAGSYMDCIYVDAQGRIDELDDMMYSILGKVEDECRILWEAVLNNSDCSRHFFNKDVDIKEKNLDEIFKQVFMQLPEMEYNTSIENSTISFAEALDQLLG
jgi:hypothetical protein